MAGTRYSPRQLLVGLAAVVVIVCCGLYVHRQWQRLDPKRARPGPPTAAQRWRLSQSGGAGLSDAASVVDWRLSARPAMAPADTPPVIARSPTWFSYSLDSTGTLQWRLPEVRPAVAIAVDVVLTSSDGKAPSLWPGLAALRLLRGESPDGPFRPVSEVPRDQAAQGVPERSVRVGSAETLYTHRIVVFDLNPDLSAVQYYTIQMIGAGGEVLEESGPCTGWAMAAPEAQAETDAQGLLALKWKAPTLPAKRFVGQPHLVTGLSSATHYLAFDALSSTVRELGRFPVAAGEFTVPFPMGDRNSNQMVAQLAVIGATRRQTWSRSRGPAEDTVLVGVSAVVAGRGGQPALSEARPEPDPLALTPLKVDYTHAANRRGTAFTVQSRGLLSADFESLAVRYAKRGTTKAITGANWSSFEEPAGLGERCVYTLTVRDGDAMKTLTASAYSPPAPVGFRAIAAPDAIGLLWDPLVIETDEWAAPPELVMRRLAATEAQALFGNAVSLSVDFVEIARLPATATEFADRQVRPGDEYFYALDLEGVVRATCTLGDRRDIAINLPVRCGSGLNGTWAPLLVKAEISGPVRVAVSTGMLRGTEAETARAAMEAGLRCEPWIRLVERSDAGQLLDEGHLTAFGKGDARAGTAGPAPAVQAADVVVDCRMHGDVRTPRNEVGLTDVGRQQREVLGSWAAHETPWAEVAAAVVSRLKAQFPDWEQRAARAAAPADAPARLTLAVMALEPLIAACDDTLPPGTLEGLLAVALSESGRWEVVDREHLAAVMAEQGLTAASGSSKALALGRLVHADAVVTGTYTLKQGRIGLAGRLVSVASGHHLATLEVAGSRDDLQALAGQFADAAAGASLETAPATTDSATRRALEMRASTGGLNTLAAAKTAAYVGGGDLTTLTQLGEAYLQRNQMEEALNCFRQALDLAEEENPTDAIGVSRIDVLRMAMDDLLRRLGRPRERVDLWQRAAAHAAGEALDGVTSRMLALALADTGEPEAALAALRRAKEPHQDSRASILFATLGDVTAAVDILARARWIEPGRTVTYDREDRALGPGYAAAVHLLALASPEARQRLLESMVTQLGGLRPVQALRAAMERRRDGPLPTALLHVALDAALATGDEEAVAALLQDLQNRQPEDLALFNELSAAAVVLSRHGRHQEEAAVAGRALGLGIKGESAEMARTVIRRRLEAQRDGAGRRPAPAGPGFDEAFWQFVTAGGGRVAGADPDRFILTETGFVTRVRAPRQEVVWQYNLHFRKPFPRRSPPDRKAVLTDAQNGFWITSSAVFACNFLDGVVHALDLATGTPLWTHTEWTTVSPPVVCPQHDTCVCVVNGFGELVILAAADGHLIHRVPAPEKLADGWVENLPDIRVAPALAPGREVLWTDWVRVSMNHPTGFYKRNYWSLPGSDPYDAVVTDLNRPGVYSYNMASGEVRIDDPSLKAQLNTEDVQRGIASQDTGESLDHVFLAARSGDRQKALPALLKILRDPAIDEDTRNRTLYPILDLGGDDGLNAVIDALTDPSSRVRSEAERVLHGAGHRRERIPPAALGRLAKIVHESDESIAIGLVRTLVHLGGLGIKPLIQDILDNPASPLRARAALVLAEAGDASVLPILQPLVRDDLPFEKQRDLVQTLSALGDPRARRLYLSTIDTAGWLAKAGDTTRRDSRPSDLAQARTLLYNIERYAPDPTLVPFLEELSTHYDGALTDLVCAALGRIGAPRSVPFLIALLPEPRPGGRPGIPDKRALAALQALRQISGENYDTKRAEWQSWWETHRAELETRTKPPEGPAAGAGQDAP